MRGFLAKRSPGAIVVSIIALVLAMGGVGYAAGGLTTTKVRSISHNQAKNYFDSHIGSASVAHAVSANTATSATNATTASNANALGGVAPAGYTKTSCNGQSGAIKGWAFINASAAFSSSFVNVAGYNCSGGAIQAERIGVGLYEVRFVGSPVTVMVGTVNGGSAPAGTIDSHNVAGGDFVIGTRDPGGALGDGHAFAIIAP